MNLQAIILCGGSSRRMGEPKAWLDFLGEPMLARVARLLESQIPAAAIHCVAASDQPLPPLPSKVHIVRDRAPDCGPLEGLATGLAAASTADVVFVTTCDAPLLVPQLPLYLASLLGEHEAVVPRIDGQLYPLTATYRPRVVTVANSRLAQDERRVIDFVAQLDTRYVERDELRAVDPELMSLQNCNTPEEYARLMQLGLQLAL